MNRWLVLLIASLIALTTISATATTARAQFDQPSVRPQFGLAIASSFGVSFGGLVTFPVAPNIAVGPVFEFSTAGRKWDVQGQNLETDGSNTLIFGGRFYYLFTPDTDFPWYLSAGISFVNFSSIDKFNDGTPIQFQDNTGAAVQGEIKGATRFAFSFGSGTMFPLDDRMSLVIEGNSYIGGHGDRKGQAGNTDDIDLNQVLDGGAFWIVDFTVGLEIPLGR